MQDRSVHIGGSSKNTNIITGDNGKITQNAQAAELSPVEQLYARQLTSALTKEIPASLHAHISDLVETLARAVNLVITTGRTPSSPDEAISESVLQAISGKEIPIGQTLISFGEGNQLGDVKINDVAHGNIIKLYFYTR